MPHRLRWHQYLTINIQWFALSTAAGSISPIILPYLVALLVEPGQKNSALAAVRVVSLAVAMAVQPMAGLLSDRCPLRWGRRRPYILAGTLGSVLLLVLIGISPSLAGPSAGGAPGSAPGAGVAYLVLLAAIVLWQGTSNVSQGALQALIPDLVPEEQRGRASGAKAFLELTAVVPILLIGALVDGDRIWLALGLVGMAVLVPLLVTVLAVREVPCKQQPAVPIAASVLRFVLLALFFLAVTQAAGWAVRGAGDSLLRQDWPVGARAAVAGTAGLGAMAAAILAGVHLGVRVGLGPQAGKRPAFIWWVVNRLLFLAAIGSIQGFTLYFLRDVHGVPNAASMASRMTAVVAVFLLPSVLLGGALADRMGRRLLVAVSGLIAAAGAFLLVLAPELALVYTAAAILGIGTGVFMATNWALGSDLVPADEAGRYLGVSNLSGAGAGIVGVGIGGPLADMVNALQSGLGYLAIFSAYGVLFLLSAVAIARVHAR